MALCRKCLHVKSKPITKDAYKMQEQILDTVEAVKHSLNPKYPYLAGDSTLMNLAKLFIKEYSDFLCQDTYHYDRKVCNKCGVEWTERDEVCDDEIEARLEAVQHIIPDLIRLNEKTILSLNEHVMDLLKVDCNYGDWQNHYEK